MFQLQFEFVHSPYRTWILWSFRCYFPRRRFLRARMQLREPDLAAPVAVHRHDGLHATGYRHRSR